MGIYFDSLIMDFFTFLIVLIVTFYIYAKYVYQHWARNHITHLKPSFPFGNTRALLLRKEAISTTFYKMYKEFKKQNVSFGGYYLTLSPELLILDPEIIKQIFVKNFQHFTDHGTFSDEETDPLTLHLFNLEGEQWKFIRSKLTPAFTSVKMKMIFSTMVDCSNELNNILTKSFSKSEPLDTNNILSKYSMDVIGRCAFGIDCNCLKYENSEFLKYGILTFEPKGIDKFCNILAFLLPNFYKFFKIPVLNKDISNFYMRIVGETIKYREESKITRNDFMQILLQLKNEGQVLSDDAQTVSNNTTNKVLTLNELAAQCFVFLTAGFDTTANTLTFCLYELVKNPDIQKKVKEEINTILKNYDGKITYDAVMEMHYMDKVINETLRKHPVAGILHRRCTKDFRLPKSNYVIRKGEMIRISVLGIHRDPNYYPDPEKFDPERFSEEEKSKRDPVTFMPFGYGPRICIGLRFSMMVTKVGLTALLKNYRFTLNKNTSDPLVIDPNNIVMTPKGKIWVDVHKD